MSTFTEPEPAPLPGSPQSKPPSGELPPVEPPTVGFILQLFVIPMVIVTIIVVVWLLFNWLAHMGSNPTELVQDLRRLNDASWQKALTLADLLRNPQYAHLKKDPALAKELAEVLDDQLATASMDEKPIRLRMFLCRALGEFQVPEALPPLLKAAVQERQEPEVQVRRSAVQALAIYIAQNDTAALQKDANLKQVLIEASRERSESDPEHTRDELRSTAAYALGMLGGEAALNRLNIMLDDVYPNARYNAAIAMCRHGDVRALPVLLEMLDPANEESVKHERTEEEKPWKRVLVVQNAIRAARELVERNKATDLSSLAKALEELQDSKLEKFDPATRRGVRVEAEDVLLQLQQRDQKAAA